MINFGIVFFNKKNDFDGERETWTKISLSQVFKMGAENLL